jgi:peptidase M42 family hydrolase
MIPKLLPIDMDYVQDVLLRLLDVPSISGRTDDIMRLLGDELESLGLTTQLTRRGSLIADLPGEQDSPDRAVVVHADTIGCMVKELKDNGRLLVVPVGHFSARFAEGARVQVFTDDPDRTYTGTVLPLKASGHTFGEEVDDQGFGWQHVEVRVDESVASPGDLAELGIAVGDFVGLDALPVITPSGFVKSRHRDDKAGVAAALGACKAILDHEVILPVSAHLLVTILEEIGQGASHGLHADVAEVVSIDNAVVAPGQQSRETGVNVAMSDTTGPFDFHLTRRLLKICTDLGIPAQRDVYNHYRSDIAAAIESGAEMRAALVGFGVDASHGHERTHLDGIRNVAELVAAYLQTPLTFASDVMPVVPAHDFPTQEEAEEVRGLHEE